MLCTHCQCCCQETKMELCEADIRRLEKKGYDRGGFSELGDDRIIRLKNLNGFCYFFDRVGKRCIEYPSRPLGCRIYPINITDDGEVVIDSICPAAPSISAAEKEHKGRKLIKLLAVIDRESQNRS